MNLFQLLKNASNLVFKYLEESGNAIADAEERMWATPVERKPIMWVSHGRSFVKAVTWRTTGTIDTFIISWLITGQLLLATGIAFTEIMTKIVLFWLHERVWNKISWGKDIPK